MVLPHHSVVNRPASSSTFKCFEIACLLIDSWCFSPKRAIISNNDCSSRCASSSRMILRVESASARSNLLNSSSHFLSMQTLCNPRVACQVRNNLLSKPRANALWLTKCSHGFQPPHHWRLTFLLGTRPSLGRVPDRECLLTSPTQVAAVPMPV